MSIETAESIYEAAARDLAHAVAAQFPKGAEVIVRRGNGRWVGTIAGSPWWFSRPTAVLVEHQRTGKRHWIHYSDLEASA